MSEQILSNKYEYSRERCYSSNLAVSKRIFCIGHSPSSKYDEDRDGTRLRRTQKHDIGGSPLLTRYILRRGYRGTINAMTTLLMKLHIYLARLIMFFVRLS